MTAFMGELRAITEAAAVGIVMECVDPGNYPLADCKVIRDLKF